MQAAEGARADRGGDSRRSRTRCASCSPSPLSSRGRGVINAGLMLGRIRLDTLARGWDATPPFPGRAHATGRLRRGHLRQGLRAASPTRRSTHRRARSWPPSAGVLRGRGRRRGRPGRPGGQGIAARGAGRRRRALAAGADLVVPTQRRRRRPRSARGRELALPGPLHGAQARPGTLHLQSAWVTCGDVRA